MKYPALLPFEDALSRLDHFDTIIDVRSPAEFAEDHIPGAINCPVLDDKQRAAVGTLYKQASSFEAKKVGAAIVARNISLHIEQQFGDKPREWKPLIYCWRGGNRSGSLAHVLAKVGWPAAQLDGGYRAYRRYVNAALTALPGQFHYKVICGTTGSGKSLLLRALASQGAQVLDLEQLAMHRGSVLGNLPSAAQPSQKMFESSVWQTLRRFDPARQVFIESESKKVGNLRVPDALMQAMRASPCVSLMLSKELRVALLLREYTHFIATPELLAKQLDCLIPLHGREKIVQWQHLVSKGHMAGLVRELLDQHYDPSYLRSIERNFSQFRGAERIELTGIANEDFLAAARHLIADAACMN